ncbi:11490_t:CDS:2, partial [Funneliformis geosporum]
MSDNNETSTSKKLKSTNSGRRPKKPIWRFFEQEDELDKGHYVATCLALNHSIREAIIYMVEIREISSLNATNPK